MLLYLWEMNRNVSQNQLCTQFGVTFSVEKYWLNVQFNAHSKAYLPSEKLTHMYQNVNLVHCLVVAPFQWENTY